MQFGLYQFQTPQFCNVTNAPRMLRWCVNVKFQNANVSVHLETYLLFRHHQTHRNGMTIWTFIVQDCGVFSFLQWTTHVRKILIFSSCWRTDMPASSTKFCLKNLTGIFVTKSLSREAMLEIRQRQLPVHKSHIGLMLSDLLVTALILFTFRWTKSIGRKLWKKR